MAEAVETCDFDVWLKDTLVKLDTDDEVFSPYIKGILEGDESSDEKYEALQGILEQITESGIDELCNSILKKWNINLEAAAKEQEPKEKQIEMDEKIAKIMESQAVSVVVPKTRSKADQKLKEAILAQYSQVSDGEETDSDHETAATGSSGIDALLKNTNLEDVQADVQAKREADKAASAVKKEKDKEDRAKQKSKDQDRKDEEKKRTAKGEKRR